MSMGGEIMEELYDGLRDNLKRDINEKLHQLSYELDNFEGWEEEVLGILEG